MTWLDLTFIAVVLVFIALGARLGSLWTGSCIIGGFFGAALVDVYAVPFSGIMGVFPGSVLMAACLLYSAGIGAILIPGAVLSQIGSAFILNLIDGAFGLFTGAFTSVIVLSLFLLFSVPLFPSFEHNKAFRRSTIVKPFHRSLEEIFSHTPFKAGFARKKIRREANEKFGPAVEKAEKKIKDIIN